MAASIQLTKSEEAEHFQAKQKRGMRERINPITQCYCKWMDVTLELKRRLGVGRGSWLKKGPQSGTLHQSSIVRFA